RSEIVRILEAAQLQIAVLSRRRDAVRADIDMRQLDLIVWQRLDRSRRSGKISVRAACETDREWRAGLDRLAVHEFPAPEHGIAQSSAITEPFAPPIRQLVSQCRDIPVIDIVAGASLLESLVIESNSGSHAIVIPTINGFGKGVEAVEREALRITF